ncbi:MAG: flavodoxin family protein [Thermoproteota archaeon]|nr:flavodoxin family protein [Thermoproteota archaeon]
MNDGLQFTKLLAITGSQRKQGNSYLLAKEVLKSIREVDYEIIQLAEKEIKFCDLCGKCEFGDCILKDDFNSIIEKMKVADGLIFSFPKYFSVPSKFLCFLERLDIIQHCKKYHGFRKAGVKPDLNFRPPFEGKPFCLFVVSGLGRGEEPLRLAAYEFVGMRMKLIMHDSRPFLGVLVKGEYRGEVLKDWKGIEDCRRLVRKLVDSINH